MSIEFNVLTRERVPSMVASRMQAACKHHLNERGSQVCHSASVVGIYKYAGLVSPRDYLSHPGPGRTDCWHLSTGSSIRSELGDRHNRQYSGWCSRPIRNCLLRYNTRSLSVGSHPPWSLEPGRRPLFSFDGSIRPAFGFFVKGQRHGITIANYEKGHFQGKSYAT